MATEPNPTSPRPAFRWESGRAKMWLRIGGLGFGLVCFAGAIYTAVGEREGFAKALEALRDPPPMAVALVLASIAVGVVLSALLFHLLMRRFGKVPFLIGAPSRRFELVVRIYYHWMNIEGNHSLQPM